MFLIAASFAAHLAGEFYTQIIEERANFSIQINISGDSTGTGKSLFQTVWTRVFQGEDKSPLTSCTQAQAYEMLANGEHIYGKILN